MLGGILVVVIVETLAPVLRVLAFEERHERNALNVGGYGSTGEFEEGGSVVDVLHHLIDFSASGQAFGQVHEEGGGE